MLNYIIIDDEEAARKELAFQLSTYTELKLIGEAENGIVGIQKIETLKPDLIFLDVQMPVINGFDLIHQCDLSYNPEIIFVTAYDQYALKAFEVNALDYLLKPVSRKRLHTAILRASQRSADEKAIIANKISSISKNQHSPLKHIPVRDGHKIRLFPPEEIMWLEFQNPFVYVFTQDDRFETSFDSLKYLENRLPTEAFFRVNRNQLVNITNILAIIPYSSTQLRIQMKNDSQAELAVSREQSRLLKQKLDL